MEERSVKRNQFRTAPSLQQTNNLHTASLQNRSKYFQDILKIFAKKIFGSKLQLLCLQPTIFTQFLLKVFPKCPNICSNTNRLPQSEVSLSERSTSCPTMENCPNYLNLPHSPLTPSPLLNVDASSPLTLSTTFTFRISWKTTLLPRARHLRSEPNLLVTGFKRKDQEPKRGSEDRKVGGGRVRAGKWWSCALHYALIYNPVFWWATLHHICSIVFWSRTNQSPLFSSQPLYFAVSITSVCTLRRMH